MRSLKVSGVMTKPYPTIKRPSGLWQKGPIIFREPPTMREIKLVDAAFAVAGTALMRIMAKVQRLYPIGDDE